MACRSQRILAFRRSLEDSIGPCAACQRAWFQCIMLSALIAFGEAAIAALHSHGPSASVTGMVVHVTRASCHKGSTCHQGFCHKKGACHRASVTRRVHVTRVSVTRGVVHVTRDSGTRRVVSSACHQGFWSQEASSMSQVVHATERFWVDREKCMSPGLLVTRGVVHVSGRFWHSACHQPGGYREGGACREGFFVTREVVHVAGACCHKGGSACHRSFLSQGG